jgi:hypothetical protein
MPGRLLPTMITWSRFRGLPALTLNAAQAVITVNLTGSQTFVDPGILAVARGAALRCLTIWRQFPLRRNDFWRGRVYWMKRAGAAAR